MSIRAVDKHKQAIPSEQVKLFSTSSRLKRHQVMLVGFANASIVKKEFAYERKCTATTEPRRLGHKPAENGHCQRRLLKAPPHLQILPFLLPLQDGHLRLIFSNLNGVMFLTRMQSFCANAFRPKNGGEGRKG